MARIEIRDLEMMRGSGTKVSADGFLALSDRVFLKDHAFSIPGTTLVAPQLGFTAGLNEDALLIVELLDGTKCLPDIAGILSWRLGQPLQDVKRACADFIGQLTTCGVIRSSHIRKHEAVRRVRQRTTFSLETVSIVLTHKCNMSCIYCCNEERGQEMASVLCDKLVESLVSMGVTRVGLTGGEPTLHPRFWDIAEELSRNGMAVIVFTNGSTLSLDNVKKLVGSQVFQVCLSIDSLEEGDLERLGQREVTPSYLLDLLRSLQDAGVRVRTNTALVPGINCTEAKAERLYDTLGTMNVHERAFSEVILMGRGKDHPPVRKGFAVAAMLGRKSETHHSCMRAERDEGSNGVYTGVKRSLPKTVCGVGTQLTSIYPDGRVIPCILMTDIVAGNMTQSSLEDIWESGDGLEIFRSRETLESPICRRCPDWSRCHGGCKAKARMYGGSLNSPDLWSCAVYGHVRRAKRRFSEQRIEAFLSPLPEETN